MTEGKHLEDWTQLWEKSKGVFQRRKSWDRTVRESFELIESALIYHRNALAMYAPEAGGLHRHLRVSTPAAPPSFPWTSKEPLFSEIAPIADVKLKLGNSFIASASLRLPVAVLKAIETSISPFGGLLSGDGYWNLEALGGRFEKLKKMGCCRNTSSPGTNGVDGLVKSEPCWIISTGTHSGSGAPPGAFARRGRG
jgi:hypothetical protein